LKGLFYPNIPFFICFAKRSSLLNAYNFKLIGLTNGLFETCRRIEAVLNGAVKIERPNGVKTLMDMDFIFYKSGSYLSYKRSAW
jgi:hypothetical protein